MLNPNREFKYRGRPKLEFKSPIKNLSGMTEKQCDAIRYYLKKYDISWNLAADRAFGRQRTFPQMSYTEAATVLKAIRNILAEYGVKI